MQAVITVLDDQHCRAVQDIWSELEYDFGVRATSLRVPIPHITYQGAEAYDREQLEGILLRIARETEPFTVEADGLGIFTGPTPVLYVPVVRSPALTQLHQRLWQAITDVGSGTTLTYAPDHWIPHITLAQGDMTGRGLAEITQRFGGRRFQWHIPLTNLALITSDESEDAVYSLSFRVECGTRS